jgi:3-deoxy-7-phosphoheptulonate synthase
MILVLKQNASQNEVSGLIQNLKARGLDIHESKGENTTIIGLVGDTSHMREESLLANPVIAKVMRVNEPYKMANRKFHPEDSIITCEGKKIGGNNFAVMAGPCSVESEEQIINIAEEVKKSGATFLRGGAFKPRTSPYAFQGLGCEGIDLLLAAKKSQDFQLFRN